MSAIAGTDVAFDIEIRRGAGAYICGEETALFNSIEGKRGEPRSKPPFPVQVGLFGKPTLVNNVETLANVPGILQQGGRAWAEVGTQASTGTRLFCLSGHVGRPGLYEAPFGITLRALIDAAGGVADGRPLQAVLLGGAAGTFVGPDALDLRLTFEDVRVAGATLGSGVIMVFDDTANLAETLLRIAAFMRDESCGQCVPCRVGTVRQVELLQRLIAARASRDDARTASADLLLLTELGQAMRDASICGLGQTASSAIESAVAPPASVRTGRSRVTADPIWFHLPPPPSVIPTAPPEPVTPVDRTHDRRRQRQRRARRDHPRRLPRGRKGHPDALLPGDLDAHQRLPRVRGRSRRARECLRRPARARPKPG